MNDLIKPLFYEFDEFRVDTERRLLLRAGEPISLTPKVFDTLLLFLGNRGEVLTKDRLIGELWPDSFVEEANIAQNVAVLRKALGEKSRENKFIVTIPGRGYRFVANVKLTEQQSLLHTDAFPSDEGRLGGSATIQEFPQFTASDEAQRWNAQDERSPGEFPPVVGSSRIGRVFPYAVAAVVIALVVFAAYSLTHAGNPDPQILSQTLSVEHLSTDGGVPHAVISPDGQQVYYVRVLGDIESIRIKNIGTGDDSELIEGGREKYAGLSIAPDGKSLYFVRGFSEPGSSDLFRISIPGGIPQTIARGVEGWTDISPDGSKISFVRCPERADDYCSLFIADAANGDNEQKLATRPSPIQIGDSAFTPDGKEVVFANGQSQTGGKEFKLSKVNIANGNETEFSSERFFVIKNLGWLPGYDSLLITAARNAGDRYIFWNVDGSTGQVTSIDKPEGHFNNISLDSTASMMVSTDVIPDFKLRVYGLTEKVTDNVLAPGEGSNFTPDGKVVFPSNLSGQMDVWIAEPDGHGLRRLTATPSEERAVVASSDGRSLFFSSNRSGNAQVWKMNRDGTNPVQLTRATGGYPVSVSSDGKWVFFESNMDETLWRIAVDGTAQEELVRKSISRLVAISPDGMTLAFPDKIDAENRISISQVNGETGAKSFRVGQPNEPVARISWTGDGRSIFYIQREPVEGKAVIYKQLLSGGLPMRIREIDIGRNIASYSFAISPDESRAIVASGDWRHDLVLIKGLK